MDDAPTRLDLQRLRHRNPSELSLAARKRVAVASAVAMETDVVVTVVEHDGDHDAALGVILEAHHHSAVSVAEHDSLIEAMSRRDAEGAPDLMRAHRDRLLEEVDAFVARYDAELLERLLRLP